MVRTLLGSTAFLSILLISPQAFAAKTTPSPAMETPQLKFSGQTSFNSYFFRNKRITRATRKPSANQPCSEHKYGRGQLFAVDSARLKVNVDGKTDPGMEYGLVFVFDGDTNADHFVREDYLYLGGSWGKIYAGDTFGVQNSMAFGGYDDWGATGFMDSGILERVVNDTTGTVTSVDLVGDTSRDTKLTYFTPRWYGFQAGASYTPRTEHRGQGSIESRRSEKNPKKPFDTDNIANGLNFIHKFANEIEIGLSATSIFGQTRSEYHGSPPRRNTASFAFGGTISYCNWAFGAEYGNNGRSQQLKVGGNKVNAGQFVDFGLSYKWGATRLTTGYYYGWRKALGGGITDNFISRKSRTNAVSAAIDHKLAPGLGIYAEYAHFQMKNPAALDEANRINTTILDTCSEWKGGVPSNRANVFLVGSRLVF
ncbi:MAG: hypothetical protein A2W62_01420 [Alphaproteobacteria bacterium RIFCSPLOWO2_02_42_7]|nr:MAG: hypothetical protein A2W62_01420 [Alphaproteobacteria bacterium RIFCSPLOWO2_02_42_7]